MDSNVYYFVSKNKNNKNKNKNNDNNKNKNDIISKIVTSHFFTTNEIMNVNNIKNIKNYKTRYYVFNTAKKLTLAQYDEDTHTHLRDKKDASMLLQYDNIPIIYLNTYLKTLSSSRIYIYQLVEFYRYIIVSIKLLVASNIVHNKINFDSILINNNELPLLTNFAFSIDISKPELITHFFIDYCPDYISWPLEFHILAYFLTNKLESLSSFNIEKIIDEVSECNYILKTFGETLVKSYKTDAYEYFKKYINRSYEYIVTDILQFYNTWDNYALSIMYLRIFIGIHNSMQLEPGNKFIIFFMKLLVSNIHLNPLKRLSIDSTTNKFNNLLDSLEPKDFKEVINELQN
jgi:hypothetical protein